MTVSGVVITSDSEPASDGTTNEIQGDDRSLLSLSPTSETISAGISNYWDIIILTILVIVGTFVIYYIIKYLIGNSGDSLNLDKGELNGTGLTGQFSESSFTLDEGERKTLSYILIASHDFQPGRYTLMLGSGNN